jgi:hypothetical protein
MIEIIVGFLNNLIKLIEKYSDYIFFPAEVHFKVELKPHPFFRCLSVTYIIKNYGSRPAHNVDFSIEYISKFTKNNNIKCFPYINNDPILLSGEIKEIPILQESIFKDLPHDKGGYLVATLKYKEKKEKEIRQTKIFNIDYRNNNK